MTRLKLRFMLVMTRFALYQMARNGEGGVGGFGSEHTPNSLLYREIKDLERDLENTLDVHLD